MAAFDLLSIVGQALRILKLLCFNRHIRAINGRNSESTALGLKFFHF